MLKFATFFAGLTVIVFACDFAIARSIEFQEILSVSVPGLGDIEKVEFGDVDFDGHPEVLATDRDSVILYSYKKDQVLFGYSIGTLGEPTYDNSYGILIEDINRDYLLDVTIGVYGGDPYFSPTWFKVFFQNGTSFFGPVDSLTIEYKTNPADLFFSSTGLGLFDAIDYDSDGCREFSFSVDSSTESSGFYQDVGSLKAITRIYRSFPDFLIYQDNVFYIDVKPLPEPHNDFFVRHRHVESYSHTWGSGIYREASGYSFDIITEPGKTMTNPGPPGARSKSSSSSCNHSSDYSIAMVKCMGNLDLNNAGIEGIVYSGARGCCYDPPEAICTSTEFSFKLYSFNNPNVPAKIRELADIGEAYNFIYLPDYPGYFFASVGNRFVQFNGDDGSEFQSTEAVPAGIWKWDYPYDDGKPYLVTLDSNVVTIYEPVVITAVDGGEDRPLPTALSLGRPYPNPFNAVQTIPVTSKPGRPLTVDIYNLLGQKVDRIYSGVSYSQQFNLSWKADKFPSGIYLIRAICGDETAVVRSLLLK